MILLRRKLSELAVDRSDLACLIRLDIPGVSSFDSSSGFTLNHFWVSFGTAYDWLLICSSLKGEDSVLYVGFLLRSGFPIFTPAFNMVF